MMLSSQMIPYNQEEWIIGGAGLHSGVPEPTPA